MKIFLISTLVLAVSMSVTAYAKNLTKEGNKLLKEGYESTGIAAVEQIRMPINSTFKASVDIYKQYYKKAFANSDYENFYKSVEGKDEKEVKEIFSSLPKEKQEQIMAVNEANDEILTSIGTLLTELVAQQLAFQNLDTKSALSGLSMWDMPSALGAVSVTGEELVFISDSIGEIYRISEILDAQKSAV